MDHNLSKLCEDFNQALSLGEIKNLPPKIFKIKQILSRNSKVTSEGFEILFDQLGRDSEDRKKILNAINGYINWTSALKKIDLQPVDNTSEEFSILIGETNLPLVWDFSIDPIFIDAKFKFKDQLIQYLKNNKQKNIFIYKEGNIFDQVSKKSFNTYDAPKYFNSLKRILGLNCQFISSDSRSEQKDFIDYIVNILSDVRSRRNTILHFNKLWHENQRNGLDIRLNARCHEDLRPYFKGKNVLVLSPGPSLKFAIKALQTKKRNQFILIALAQSMPALAKFNIVPEFVMVVDPQDFSFVLDDWTDCSEISLIAEESIHENFLRKNFREVFTVITNKDIIGLDRAFGVSRMDLEGGTVALAACSLAAQFNVASITLSGQDLTISEGNYLVSGGLTEKYISSVDGNPILEYQYEEGGNTEVVQQDLIPVSGWRNENLFSSPEYAIYLSQFESFANQTSKIKLYNTSFGGANIRGFENILFKELDLKPAKEKIKFESIFEKKPLYFDDFTNFIFKNLDDTKKVLLHLQKIIKVLERKSRKQEAKLNIINNLEIKMIELSKKNPLISSIVSDAIIRLNRAIIYVSNLDENLNLSYKFYNELKKALTMYQSSLNSAIKTLELEAVR